MTQHLRNVEGFEPATDQIIKIAILAVGGQGGGVLSNWIVDVARRAGFAVQATSVAGVAQRTGATIYYIEMMPMTDRQPVFSLAPAAGDVDILIAAELMEAGRAVARGFVSPDRTKVVASTHRQLATVEKVVPGDGTADGDLVQKVVESQSGQIVAFDMQHIAQEAGTAISASLFGALAGSGFLPFAAGAFRETVKSSARGVAANLTAFERALAVSSGATSEAESPDERPTMDTPVGPQHLLGKFENQVARVNALPLAVSTTAQLGLRKVTDFQDLDYGDAYLRILEAAIPQDRADKDFAYTQKLAKYLATAMAYDDVIRVADVKTRKSRISGIDAEIGTGKGTEISTGAQAITQITEYTHPGAAEIISLFPRKLGLWAERRGWVMRLVGRLFGGGRRIRSDRIGGYLSLYLLAGLRRWRRGMLRHGREWDHIQHWLDLAEARLSTNYDLAVATLACRRLIKGYSDTHARGLAKYDKVLAGTQMIADRDDAAQWTDRLMQAALADAEGSQLDGALETIRSFADR